MKRGRFSPLLTWPRQAAASLFDALRRFADRRKSVTLSLFALLGCACASAGRLASAAALLFALFCALAAIKLRRLRRTLLPGLIALSLFTCWYAVNDRVPPLPAEGKYHLSATVSGVPLAQTGKHRTVVTLKNAQIDGQRIPGRVRMYIYGSAPSLIEGDRVHFDEAKLSLPSSRQNPGGFDFAAYLKRRGVFLCASAQGADTALAGATFSPMRALTLARQSLSDTADQFFASDADVIKAVLLGDRSDLDDALYNDFSTSGLSHLIALSGLHVSAIALLLEALLKLIRLPRGPRFALTLIALTVYTLMTGASSSTVRAVVMYALLCAGLLLGYRVDTLTRLALSLLIQLAANPLLIGDTGFVLSYASVTGILCFADTAELRQKGIWAKLLSGARTSFSAQVFTYPLLAGFFYTVPLLGVP
ncbi:MAG: ComEC family competence protein, partial [Clostridia bacterium]|nr:ComEC family competence protein [Clostridia bacterium]